MMTPHRRDRCRACGRVLPAWLPAAQRPTGRDQHMTKESADATPYEPFETVMEHARGVLRHRSPGATGRTVARVNAVRHPPPGVRATLAHQIYPRTDVSGPCGAAAQRGRA